MNGLGLNWVGKEKAMDINGIPMRTLTTKKIIGESTDGMLIHGDNLDALRALLPKYRGKIKCIFIDPPYNTKTAFAQYDDSLEHSTWLSMMAPRLILLRQLLSEDGAFFITLDDAEAHYFKVLTDEIFGRQNYVGSFIWQKRKGGGNDSFFMATDHDYVFAYVKNADKTLHQKWRVPYDEEYLKRYREIDTDGTRFYWDTVSRDGLRNPIPVTIQCPDGSVLNINSQKSQATILEGLKTGDIRLIQSKGKWTLHHKIRMPAAGRVARSILTVGTNKDSSDEMINLFDKGNAFDYAKPESLLQFILELCTKKGDLVLDSFAGSGTTCAVAHKMGRKWIGIEMGEQANTHIIPRLQKVVDGEQGGISKEVNWNGGGGFVIRKLGKKVMLADGEINPDLTIEEKADLIFSSEVGIPLMQDYKLPLLGETSDKRIFYSPKAKDIDLRNFKPNSKTNILYCDTHNLSDETVINLNLIIKRLPQGLGGQNAI